MLNYIMVVSYTAVRWILLILAYMISLGRTLKIDAIWSIMARNPVIVSTIPPLWVYISHNALRWCHNGRDSVSNHQPRDCLLNRLNRRRSKKTSKLRVTGLYAGISSETGEFPAQMASNAENVSVWWRHHGNTFPERVAVPIYIPTKIMCIVRLIQLNRNLAMTMNASKIANTPTLIDFSRWTEKTQR